MTSTNSLPRRPLKNDAIGPRRLEQHERLTRWWTWSKLPALRRATAVSALSVLGLLTLLLPWMATGSTHRSAYSLASALSASGMLNGAWEQALYGALIALPILVALVCVATMFGRVHLGAFLVAIEGALLIIASLLALSKLGARADFGPWLAICAGLLGASTSGFIMIMRGQLNVGRI